MADNNIFIKGTKFAQTALALLRKTIKAPGLFTTKYGVADFRGAEGDTIGVKRPVVLAARRKPWRGDDEIIIDKLVNTKIQVTLDQHVYSAVELSPEEETLDEVDYVRDVQAPQVDAVARDVASIVVAALTGATFVNSVKFNPNSADPRESDPRKVALRGSEPVPEGVRADDRPLLAGRRGHLRGDRRAREAPGRGHRGHPRGAA